MNDVTGHPLVGPARRCVAPWKEPDAAARRGSVDAAYRALAEGRAAVEKAAAELPAPCGGKKHDWAAVTASAELIVDAATVCALRVVEHGVPRPSPAEVEQVRWSR